MCPLPQLRAAAVTLTLLIAIAAMLPALTAAQTPGTDGASLQGCAAPGTVSVVAGAAGGKAVTIAETETGITLTMPDGTTHDLPAGELRLEPGMAIVLADDGTHMVLSTATGETWLFDPVEYRDFQAGMTPATAPFVQTGPYVAAPITDDGLDWQIVDMRTGESATTSEILGGPFPVAADAYALPNSGDDRGIAAIRFRQMAEPIAGLGATPTPFANVGATLVIPGDLAGAAFVDLEPEALLFHDADPMLFAGNRSVVFSPDHSQVAWATGSGDPFGETHEVLVASLDALEEPTAYLAPGAPDARVPLLFTPDGTALLALVDGALTRIDLATGEAQPANAPGITGEGIRVANPVDGTIIYDAGTPEQPEVMLYDAATDTATPLPELNAYPWIYPLAGWTYAGATGAGDPASTVLIDTRTGQIATDLPTAGDNQTVPSEVMLAGDFRDGVLVTGRPDGTVLVQDGATGEAWVTPMPEGMEPGLVPRLSISPDARCLLLSTTTAGSNMPFASWLAPIAAGATWTALETPALGWWQIGGE